MELIELGSNSALPFINEITLAKVTSLSHHFLIRSLSLDSVCGLNSVIL